MKSRKISALPILLLGCAVAIVAGCNHSPDTTTASASNNAKSRFVAVAPNEADLAKMHLNYPTFKPAPDGTYMEYVPLPPKAGNVIVGINAAGSYTAKLIDSKCAFDVRVVPSEGSPFLLNTATATHNFTLTKPGQITSTMSDSAANNYSCNVNVAPI